MKIAELRMTNFGPYFGQHQVMLAGSRPVTVVFGENMRGKTSLLNALRWGLYGAALDRFGHGMPTLRLINWDAADAHDWSMSIEIDLEVDSDTYRVLRHVQPRLPKMTPTNDRDFEETFQVRRNTNWLSAADAVKEVNRVFPESISRFFLFDGELLNDYETLIADDKSQARVVKESIERILGLPALSHGLTDLQGLLRDATRRQQHLAEQDESARLYGAASAKLQGEIEQAEIDIADMEGQLEEYAVKRAELDDELRTTAGIEQEAIRLQELDKQIAGLGQGEARLVTERASRLSEGWRDLIQPLLQQRIDGLEASMSERFKRAREAGVLRNRIEELEGLKMGSICPTCGQTVASTVDPDVVIQEVLKLNQELKGLEPIEAGNEDLGAALGRLRHIRPAGVAQLLRQRDDDIRRCRVETADLRLQRDEINDRLRGHDHTQVVKNRHSYELLMKEIGTLESRIADRRSEIAKKQDEIGKFRVYIRRESGPAMAALNREVALYEQLVDVFQRGRNMLRDRLKTQVEKDASEIFLEMTTSTSYTGLRINDNYGLAIVDGGKEVRVRSAGAEQVVALALIGALNRNAVRRGPLVMDTPFGRLDPDHRANILAALPELTDQVVLLVHGGEIARDGGLLEPIRNLVDREYAIQPISSRRSEIVSTGAKP